jgi:hypothetical protein
MLLCELKSASEDLRLFDLGLNGWNIFSSKWPKWGVHKIRLFVQILKTYLRDKMQV